MSGLRVLVPTSRSWYRIVSAGAILDFENAMAESAVVDFVDVPPLGRRARIRAAVSERRPRRIALSGDYDLCFLAVFQPEADRALAFLEGLRRRCRRVVVYVFDAWAASTASLRRHRELWRLCDKVFVFVSGRRRCLGPRASLPLSTICLRRSIRRGSIPSRTARSMSSRSGGDSSRCTGTWSASPHGTASGTSSRSRERPSRSTSRTASSCSRGSADRHASRSAGRSR